MLLVLTMMQKTLLTNLDKGILVEKDVPAVIEVWKASPEVLKIRLNKRWNIINFKLGK